MLDPFCGTGTTALVCAERGIACDTTDINPFLLWLTRAKTRPYTPGESCRRHRAQRSRPSEPIAATGDGQAWVPPLHQIEKWWDEATQAALARGLAAMQASASEPSAAVDLLKLAFCRALIERSRQLRPPVDVVQAEANWGALRDRR